MVTALGNIARIFILAYDWGISLIVEYVCHIQRKIKYLVTESDIENIPYDGTKSTLWGHWKINPRTIT